MRQVRVMRLAHIKFIILTFDSKNLSLRKLVNSESILTNFKFKHSIILTVIFFLMKAYYYSSIVFFLFRVYTLNLVSFWKGKQLISCFLSTY